jgi:hypothetical protein
VVYVTDLPESVGLYDLNNPLQRLSVNGSDHVSLGAITVGGYNPNTS